MAQRNPTLFNSTPLKLGLFAANCSSGSAMVDIPGRWDASWEHNLRLAQLADEVGLDCMVPIGRWKGYGGATNANGSAWETITWACGLLAATRRITVFGPVHAPLIHPVLAAKQMVTADHIGQGRFGLNIVCGWNEDELEMFGASMREHDLRYEYGQEWWGILKQLWSGEGPADFEGRFFQLKGLQGLPTPWGGRRPIMMNAGASAAGRAFAIRNSDLHFDSIHEPALRLARIRETKALARAHGHEIQVFSTASVVCRPTTRELDDFLAYCVEHADWQGKENLAAAHYRNFNVQSIERGTHERIRLTNQAQAALTHGGTAILGTPDQVAQGLAEFAAGGFDGLALSFVDYLEELPYFAQEVLPRLERMGLRHPVGA